MKHIYQLGNADTELILVLNCGSSSIKFALFEAQDPARSEAARELPRKAIWNGKVQGIGGPNPDFGARDAPAAPVSLDPAQPYHAALALIREHVVRWLAGRPLAAVAHRVVHGGSKYSQPVRVDAQVLADLKDFIPLAPLHQPFALEAMDILLREQPDLPQIACFDTGFHHSLPMVEQLLPLPIAMWERGVRRYGFHGLSYEYMALALEERHGELARGRTIVAHLGSGASLCGMHELRSVATTMGFSALDGLMMGTRTGTLDPGALLYLMEIEKLTLEQVGHVLYHESGLLGVSGLSSEPRVIVRHENDAGTKGDWARWALALYVRRIVREIASMVAALGGLDLLVFTAGVGEHCAFIRERVCRDLAFLGLQIDPGANEADAAVISGESSAVRVGVEITNEEWIAARHALRLLAPAAREKATLTS